MMTPEQYLKERDKLNILKEGTLAYMIALEAVKDAISITAKAEKDAQRYRWLRNESWAGYNAHKHKPEVFETVTMVRGAAGNVKTILAEEALDEAVDAAIAQQKEKQG